MNQEQAQRKKAPNHAETDARHQHVEELGDFTTTLASAADFRAGNRHWRGLRGSSVGAASPDRTIHEPVLFWTLEHRDGFSSWKSLGNLCCFCAGGRRAGHWSDGALRFGKNSGTWNSGSDRSDSDQREPRRTESGDSKTDIFRDFDRVRRTVWRGRANHYDRRGVRVADRAAIPFDQRRTENSAGRGRGGRYVGDFRVSGGGGVACGRTVVI